jgi:putative transposase
MIDDAIAELTPVLGSKRAACTATGRPQANHYRRHRQSPAPPRPVRQRRPQPRALSDIERDTVRALLDSPDFVDKAPATVYHELLDEGVYLASVSSMYRILRAHGEVTERRRQATHPARIKPELVATKPNQCWSWDITKLHGPAKWSYFYLYVIIDIYSRYVVGWLIAEAESAVLAREAARRHHHQAGHRPRHVDHPRRQRLIHGQQAGGVPARRPGRDQDPLAAAHQQ